MVKVDYLRIMSKDRSILEQLLAYFGVAELDPVKGPGLYHYGWREDHNGAMLLGGGREDMGFCLQLSGDILERVGDRVKWAFVFCYRGLCRASRVDLAGHGKVSAIQKLDKAVRAGVACTYMRRWRTIEDDSGGMTVYCGSPKSDCQWRMYDKFAESKDAQYLGLARFEHQVEGEPAAKLAALIGSGIGTLGQIFGSCVESAFRTESLAFLRKFVQKGGLQVKLTARALPLSGERLIKFVGRLRSVLGAFVDIAGVDTLVSVATNSGRKWTHESAVRQWRFDYGSSNNFVRC